MKIELFDLIEPILSYYPNSSHQNLIMEAAIFSSHAHKDQKRKYTNLPYFFHCLEVANILTNAGQSPELIAAAFLHDVIEDCEVKKETLLEKFGKEVTYYVLNVTDGAKPEDGNREARKKIERRHLAGACPNGKTLKLADLISNTTNIIYLDTKFAKVYLHEKRLLLPFLTEGNERLYTIASGLSSDNTIEFLRCHQFATQAMVLKRKGGIDSLIFKADL